MSSMKKEVGDGVADEVSAAHSGSALRSGPEDGTSPAIANAPPRKATPGPWKAHHGWSSDLDDSTIRQYPDYCEVTGGSHDDKTWFSMSGHVGLANAKLMASAPTLLEQNTELLEALKGLVNAPGYNEAIENYGASQHARAIISKCEAQNA